MKNWTRHLPNGVTLLRPALACVFAALLPGRFRGDIGPVVPLLLFAAICLSDFLDGRLARALGAVSKTGAYLDLYSDLFYIAVSLVVLNILGPIPVWFTGVVIAKFIEYLITSRILCRGGGAFAPDLLGRVAAGLFFVVPGLVCAFYGFWSWALFVDCVLYLTTAFVVVSSIARWMSCIRTAKRGVIHEH